MLARPWTNPCHALSVCSSALGSRVNWPLGFLIAAIGSGAIIFNYIIWLHVIVQEWLLVCQSWPLCHGIVMSQKDFPIRDDSSLITSSVHLECLPNAEQELPAGEVFLH